MLVEYSSKPIILAGGLNAENVYEAIIKVKPAGVDSHTGVEYENGVKNKVKVQQFCQEAIKAFDEINKIIFIIIKYIIFQKIYKAFFIHTAFFI